MLAIIALIAFFSIRGGGDKDEKRSTNLRSLLLILIGMPNWDLFNNLVQSYNNATPAEREEFINSCSEEELDFIVKCQQDFVNPAGMEIASRAYNKAAGY